jgi:hypothetical protein
MRNGARASSYFINTRSTANEPAMITLHDGQGKVVKDPEGQRGAAGANDRIRLAVPKEFFQFTTEGGTTAERMDDQTAGLRSPSNTPCS